MKLCRDKNSRKIITPSSAILDPRGVFLLLRCGLGTDQTDDDLHRPLMYIWQGSQASDETTAAVTVKGLMMCSILLQHQHHRQHYIKHIQQMKKETSLSSELDVKPSSPGANTRHLINTAVVRVVKEGQETEVFLSYLLRDGPYKATGGEGAQAHAHAHAHFDDFFDHKPSIDEALQQQVRVVCAYTTKPFPFTCHIQ